MNKTRLFPALLFLLLPLFSTVIAQNCACTQCDIPIVANYLRAFTMNVNGAVFNNLSTVDQGVCEVEIDFAHDFISDLQLVLVSPSGNFVRLVSMNNANDTTYFSRWKIRFKPCGEQVVPDAGFAANFDDNTNWPKSSTMTGSYYPSLGCLEDFNAGSVNGTWQLQVNSSGYRGVGFISGFKISFCQPQGIQCTGLNYILTAGEDCNSAEPLPPNILSYIGNTALFAPGFAPGFCGTIENDQWFTFISTCDTVAFTITSGYCINGNGVQMALYEDCNVPPIACNGGNQGCGFCSYTIVADVVPGHPYYLLIDGFGGDQCDFEFTIPPGCFSTIGDPPPPADVPHGCKDAQHEVSLQEPVFGAAGYIWSATNGALVNGQTETVVPGPGNLSVTLTLGDEDGQVCVRAYNYTDTSGTLCLPFTVDTIIYLVENAMICYDELPYFSEYAGNGVPPIYYAGEYHFLLQDYYTEDGELYPCDVHLNLSLTVDGGFSVLPDVLALGESYTLPNGQIVESSGIFFWTDSLASGCYFDHTQGIYLIPFFQNSDGCAPDTVTFVMPGSGVTLACPGGSPALVGGAGVKKVVYQNAGVYDLIAHKGALTFLFSDTLNFNFPAAPLAIFSLSANDGVVTFTNQSLNATAYFWNFGDGVTSTEANPVHAYVSSGNYTVTLQAIGLCNVASSSQALQITLLQAPQAAFGASNNNGCQPLVVQFTDLSTGTPTAWQWQFPGGTPSSSTEQNPSVIYLNPGVYDVSLTAENQFGQNVAAQNSVVNVAALPTVVFGFSVTGSTVAFSNTSLIASAYLWNFGDGTTSTEVNPTHSFAAPGAYLVTLQADNTCGSSILQQYVTIELQPPLAQFSISQTEGCAPATVQFFDQSVVNPDTWFWEFPGGVPATSTEQNPLVTYAAPGMYSISLTVENAAGSNTLVKTDLLTVLPAPDADFSFSLNAGLAAFTNQSAGGLPLEWNFGDPASGSLNYSTEESPTHLYTVDGDYPVRLVIAGDCGLDTVTQVVHIQLSGSHSVGQLAWLHISPNPSDGHFQFELRDEPSPTLSWRVFNALGQCVALKELGNFDGFFVEKMDLSPLPASMYWLELRTAEKRTVVRLVKE